MSTTDPQAATPSGIYAGPGTSFGTLLRLLGFRTQLAAAERFGWRGGEVGDLCRGRVPHRRAIQTIAQKTGVPAATILASVIASAEESASSLASDLGVGAQLTKARIENAAAYVRASQ